MPQILESGKLRVAVSADRAPLNFKNASGEIVGFEVDIVEALATAMGLELSLVQALRRAARGVENAEGRPRDLGPHDDARAQCARRLRGALLRLGDVGLVAPARSAVSRTRRARRRRRRYAAVSGSTSEQFIARLLPSAELVAVRDYDAGVQMVVDGKVDALFADFLVCAVAVWSPSRSRLSMAPDAVHDRAARHRGSPDAPLLLNLVENYLDTLDYTGLLASYKAKWLADGEGWWRS